ncbi:MAG TPA: ABC transporter permease [Gemmatimonadales bacterium]|jgi:putative ABC transport system permease protein|nr:ABC transporter permease [Gemmatimonadales bacterium]
MTDAIRRDVRYAVRSLLRSPAFTAIAVLTLALGIGANTAIFSVVYSVLLRPLAYGEPEQLISIRSAYAGSGAQDIPSSQPEYNDYRAEIESLQDLAAVYPISINLTGLGEPRRIQAAVVSDNYFRLLGVAPALGRDFTPEDDRGQIGYVVIISHELWRQGFAGDPGIIGKTVRLDDDPMTIIGVMPRGFRHVLESGASPMEVWAPVALDNPDPDFLNSRTARVYDLIGRLEPGRTVEDARAEFAVLATRLRERYPQVYPEAQGWHPVAQPLAEQVVGDVRPALLVLLGAVGFVLLIGCANVANLLLARATAREREIAVRTALGGSRWRLVRQLLTESLVLALVGGVLGLLLAAWGASALGRLVALYLPRAGEIELSLPVLGFTTVLILLTGVVFGLMPALQASRADLQGVLKDAARGSSAGAPRTRMRAALVVAEVAIALMLLAGAGLLLRSFQRLMAVEYGFNPDRLLTLQVWLPVPNDRDKGRYQTHEQRRGFYDRVLTAVTGVAGVRDAALISRLPLRGQNDVRIVIEGRPLDPDQPPPSSEIRLVSPNYFRTMGIPLLAGEGLPELADSLSRGSVVVNRTMADEFWPGEDPIGRRVRIFGGDGPWVTVVGIVGDVRQIGLTEPPRQELYLSYRAISSQEMSLVVRTGEAEPERLGAAVTAAIQGVDPEQPVFGVMSMERVIALVSAERRVSLVLLLVFAAMALLLSALGIYGVMAYTTTQRRHEIGIRLALGAGSPDVLRLVVGQGMRLVILGLAAGLLGAWLLSRALASQLYGITAQDPLTYASVAALLGAVALVATWVPARRATRVDPMLSLRSE